MRRCSKEPDYSDLSKYIKTEQHRPRRTLADNSIGPDHRFACAVDNRLPKAEQYKLVIAHAERMGDTAGASFYRQQLKELK